MLNQKPPISATDESCGGCNLKHGVTIPQSSHSLINACCLVGSNTTGCNYELNLAAAEYGSDHHGVILAVLDVLLAASIGSPRET